MHRREILKLCTLVLGTQISTACTSLVISRESDAGLKTVDVPDKRVTALAETIIPATDTPGAVEAGVPAFVEELLNDWYTTAEHQRFVSGLDDLDREARSRHGSDFAACTAEQQGMLLGTLMTGDEQQQAFFQMAREAVVVGYFTSEVGATQTLRYLPMPGVYDGEYPLTPSDTQFTY